MSTVRATAVLTASDGTKSESVGVVTLAHHDRHLRRKLLTLDGSGEVLVDLPEPVLLGDGDRLVLENGGEVLVRSAPEHLLEIRGRDRVHLTELAWHIGNRHLAAEVGETHLRILFDHVIADMVAGLGGTAREIHAPFQPVTGAYRGHSHVHVHTQGHTHEY